MKTIHLYGALKEQFGDQFTLDVDTPVEAIRALGSQLNGFVETIRDGDWYVVRGPLEKEGATLDEETLDFTLGSETEVHILPAVAGAGSDAGKIITGVVMVAAAFYTGGASLAAWGAGATAMGAMGAGLILAGSASMLAQTPEVGDYDDNSSPDERASHLFNGPVNRSTQGVAIPLIYGKVYTGSIVVSAGMTTEEL